LFLGVHFGNQRFPSANFYPSSKLGQALATQVSSLSL
jgi:hypothetical protein